jgi:anti-anti-sigma factor
MTEPQFHHIRCRLERGVLVLTITERQVQGDDLADELRKEFAQAAEYFSSRRVVVDFHVVDFLGSAGFRPLLSLYRRLRDQGGSMLFCNLAPNVAEVFHVTRLISTSRQYPAPFETAPTLEEAVARQSAAAEAGA